MSLTRIKDGLTAIASEVLEDVSKEAEAIILKTEADAKEILKTGKKEAAKIYTIKVTEAKAKTEVEKRRIESLTEVEVRNQLLQTKETLVDEAFDKAVARINEFVKTKAYHDYLLKFIQEAVKKVGSKNLTVHVNSKDKNWLEKDQLENLSKKLHFDLKLAEQTENCVGGCKIQTNDGKVIYDNTIENRLQQLKPELRIEVVRIFFSQGDQ